MAFAFTVLCFLSPTAALAHAALVSSVPVDGAVIPVAPKQIMLAFNEPVSPLVLKLVRPDGTTTPLDRHALKNVTLEIEAPELGAGTHVLSWRVVSADGHPVGGALVFSVGAPSTAGPPSIDVPSERPVLIVLWLTRLGLYAGLFFGVGGALFAAWVAPAAGRAKTFVRVALGLGLIAAPAAIGVQGLDALELPLAAVASRAVWQAGFGTSFADTAMIAAAAMLAALVAFELNVKAIARPLSAMALAGTGIALAASGHAADAEPHWLTRPAIFLHAAAIVLWAGALAPLAAIVAAGGPASGAALRRFSLLIPLPLVALVVSGIILAVVQIETPSALVATSYGRVLLAKLGIVAALFILAALNRWRLTKPAAHGDEAARRSLVRAVRIELVLIALILGVASLWRFTPPPRIIAIEAARPAATHLHGDKVMADISIAPGRVGAVAVSVFVMTPMFDPLPAKEVTLSLSNPTAGIEPIRRVARLADGAWRADGLVISLSGRWKVAIDVLISDFEMVKLEGEVEIRP